MNPNEGVSVNDLVGFASLFAGRTDAYFESKGKGGRAVRAPVTLALFRAHLLGAKEIGTYPVTDDGSCRWGAIDIDLPPEDDATAFAMATDVVSVWDYYGVPAHMERSRSKGYHVWVFASEWVPAAVMRICGRYVAELAQLPERTEVNPKNDAPWLVHSGLVNTVRLPYSGRANPGRMVAVTKEGNGIDLPSFIRAASTRRVGRRALEYVYADAKRRLASQRAEANKRIQSVSEGGQPNDGSYRATQRAALILRGEADIERGERDNQFFTISKYLHSQGVPFETALTTLRRLYRDQCPDKADFHLDDALAKAERVYGR